MPARECCLFPVASSRLQAWKTRALMIAGRLHQSCFWSLGSLSMNLVEGFVLMEKVIVEGTDGLFFLMSA